MHCEMCSLIKNIILNAQEMPLYFWCVCHSATNICHRSYKNMLLYIIYIHIYIKTHIYIICINKLAFLKICLYIVWLVCNFCQESISCPWNTYQVWHAACQAWHAARQAWHILAHSACMPQVLLSLQTRCSKPICASELLVLSGYQLG